MEFWIRFSSGSNRMAVMWRRVVFQFAFESFKSWRFTSQFPNIRKNTNAKTNTIVSITKGIGLSTSPSAAGNNVQTVPSPTSSAAIKEHRTTTTLVAVCFRHIEVVMASMARLSSLMDLEFIDYPSLTRSGTLRRKSTLVTEAI
jgi:hypothetical protein